MNRRIASILCMLLLIIPLFLTSAEAADRIPEEHDFRYIGAMRVIRCKEYVTLRAEPYKSAKALAKVPLGAIVYNCSRIKQKKSFVYAEYEGLQGYILLEYLETAPEFEPAVTSSISGKMTIEELTGNGEIVLDWKDFNISVLAAHEFVKDGKVTQEILRVGCFIDGEPLWGRTETLEVFSNQPLLKAFIGGTEDDPMILLYDGGYGLTMIDLLSGSDRWTIMKGNCDLGDAAVTAVNDEGIMYIVGSDGPDPVAITQEGRILWKSSTRHPEIRHPFEITLKRDSIQVKYGEDPGQGYYLVSFDYMGDPIGIQPVSD